MAASNALRASGRAIVTRRMSPSRSTRSAPIVAEPRSVDRQFDASESRLPEADPGTHDVESQHAPGHLAAALTPLRDGGAALDEERSGPYCDFLAAGGLDGLLAFGTNGEGVLFSVEERSAGCDSSSRRRGRLQVAAHCGAQTTADTVALAADAAAAGPTPSP